MVLAYFRYANLGMGTPQRPGMLVSPAAALDAGLRGLRVDGLSKTYSRRGRAPAVDAVSDVTFEAAPGEVVGLLGPNGAGKTTTIKMIAGLVRPTSGRVQVGGIDALASRRDAARQLAVVLEGNRNVYWRLTVRENLDYFAALRGIRPNDVAARRDELIERFRLGEKANVTAMQLSRGMQQKLALACAVLVGAPVLLLDEPTLGLDVETSYELRHFLQSLARDDGRCVIVSSHDMQLVSDVCGRVVIITAGKVVADDTVDALVGVFRAIAVRFSLAAPLPHGGDLAIHRFDAHQAVDAAGRTTLDVTVADSDAFYELIGALRDAGAVVERVDGAAPDLEDVFLSILKGNRS